MPTTPHPQVQPPLLVTVSISDPQLDDEEREELAQTLYQQLLDGQDGSLEVYRPRADRPPPGAKAATATLLGVLAAAVSASSLKHLFDYLKERLRSREVTLELSGKGGKVKLTVRNAADYERVMVEARRVLAEKP